MPVWKKNLWLCCLSCFIVSIGMSQLAPMLPLYLAEMGMKGEAESLNAASAAVIAMWEMMR